MKDVAANLTSGPFNMTTPVNSGLARQTTADEELTYLMRSLAIQRDDDVKTYEHRAKRQLWLDIYNYHIVNGSAATTAAQEAKAAVDHFKAYFG